MATSGATQHVLDTPKAVAGLSPDQHSLGPNDQDYPSSTCPSTPIESKTPFNGSNATLLFRRAAMTLFLATTDATIVSATLPAISSQLRASQSEYTWVGVSYMLTQTGFQPLYGKLSDIVGRKTVLYTSMLIFVIGSLLCGLAQNMKWLIMARALAGIGGGGIVSLVWTITSEIVDVQSRAKWSQALSITWSCSAIAGPLLGGLFSGILHGTVADASGPLSWRWAFFINLPICLVAFVVIYMSLRNIEVGCCHAVSWRQLGHTFDFMGLILFMIGSSCIVIGFSFASTFGWKAPSTLALIISGLVVLVFAGCYELRTKRDALFPPSVFYNLTTVVILTINFLHNFIFNAGTFYLALYFQVVKGHSPLNAGIYMLPYSLGSSLASMPTAWFIGYWQRRNSNISAQNLVITLGLVFCTVGFGLMILLNEYTGRAFQFIYPLVSGIGLGMLFHAPYQVFTKTLRSKEIASGTSAFFLVRFTGATVGLVSHHTIFLCINSHRYLNFYFMKSVAGAIFYSRLSAQMLPLGVNPSIDLAQIASIQPLALRLKVLVSVSLSIQTIWTLCCPCAGAAFLVGTFFS
ncbi:amino acid permease ScVBA-like protein [Abortiporus biennis]|nr:amino acid permease ScVBA-like protein [Abortiporus biennis]